MFLRKFLRPLTMMEKVKETTGIIGLDADPREILIKVYDRTLKEIHQVPADESYRKAVESFTRHRLKICLEEDDWELAKKKLGNHHVEKLLEEARDEIRLVEQMKEWDPWGVPEHRSGSDQERCFSAD